MDPARCEATVATGLEVRGCDPKQPIRSESSPDIRQRGDRIMEVLDHVVHRDGVELISTELGALEWVLENRKSCAACDVRSDGVRFEALHPPAPARHAKKELAVTATGVEQGRSLGQVSPHYVHSLLLSRKQGQQEPPESHRRSQ